MVKCYSGPAVKLIESISYNIMRVATGQTKFGTWEVGSWIRKKLETSATESIRSCGMSGKIAVWMQGNQPFHIESAEVFMD